MNPPLFQRGPKKPTLLMAMLQLSRRPFEKRRPTLASPEVEPPATATPPKSPPSAPVRLSPGTYRPRAENTSVLDRETTLRALVTQQLGVRVLEGNESLALDRAVFNPQSLLDLAAAIDLQFGIYLAPERFNRELTLAQLIKVVLGGNDGSAATART